MAAPDLSLLAKRRFAPLFAVQFLGAFNDNLLKFALLFLANFTLYRAEPGRAELLATVSTGLFILPYFLFSALAGELVGLQWIVDSNGRRLENPKQPNHATDALLYFRMSVSALLP